MRPWPRRTRVLLGATGFAFVLALTLAHVYLRPILERRLRTRLEREAQAHGLLLELAEVQVGLFPPVTLRGVALTQPGRFRAVAESVRIGLAPWGHSLAGPAAHVRLGATRVSLPAGVALELEPASWRVRRLWGGGVRARYTLDDGSLELESSDADSGNGRRLRLTASRVRLGDLVHVRRGEVAVRDLGRLDAEAALVVAAPDDLRLTAEMRSSGLTLAALPSAGAGAGSAGPAGGDGAPTDVGLRLDARLRPRQGTLDVAECRVSAGDATLTLRGALWGGADDPQIDLQLAVQRVEFGRLLRAAGLDLPGSSADLGSAALAAHVRGRVRDPRSFEVEQQIDFVPPAVPVSAIARLTGPFVHEAHPTKGPRRRISVSPESPDFVAFEDVPPLFVRTLLLAEDSNFYGHRGLDFSEIPGALATNYLKGTSVRGASTIPQQLAKNLFLSREKSLARKLQEAALALLLDARLGKQRELEIYLNIIEWGPDLYGLRPAAAHYFGKAPAELTTKEMTFLVSLIPGPIKYQRSFAAGHLSPAFETLVDNLLAKLRSVEAIDEEEYQRALGEDLVVRSANGAALEALEDTSTDSPFEDEIGEPGAAPGDDPAGTNEAARDPGA